RAKLGSDLDDLVQKTFVACVEAKLRLRADTSFRAYLFACARHVLCDELRRQYRGQAHLDPDTHSVADLATTPSQAVVRKREHRLLLLALRTIPLNYQVAIELFYWEGLTGPEIASVLGIPEGTVRTYLNRGRAALTRAIRALEASEAEVRSTLDNLERWASSLREQLEPGAPQDSG